MVKEEIYKMKLHEKAYDVDASLGEGEWQVFRVPGGWIYTQWKNGTPNPVFVPFNNEFKESHDQTQ